MINWIIAGALTAVLLAELVDAWALRQLTVQCLGIRPRSRADLQKIRWYAEGFDHSIAVTSWLFGGSLALTAVAVLCGAHPVVIAACVVLTLGAHGERRFSAHLRRRALSLRPER